MTTSEEFQAAQELWKAALEDAGYGDDDVDLVLVETDDPEFTVTQYQPAGQPLAKLPAGVKTPEFRPDHARVVQVLKPLHLDIEAVPQSLMRHSLEYHRYHEESRATYALTLMIDEALKPTLSGKGLRGGAVVYNALPMVRSANAAGASLATKRFGPQAGHLNDREYGSVLRLDHEPLVPEDRAIHTVAFAAIWREEFEAFAQGHNVLADSAEDLVGDVDPDAVDWWRLLTADATFAATREAARLFTPTAEEVAVLERPEQAWRPLEGLLDRALAYGVAKIRKT